MTLANLDRLAKQLDIDEGYRKSAYEDSEGYLTIGHGILIDERLDAGLSREESMCILKEFRIPQVIEELERNLPYWDSIPGQGQEALANMCFNLGWPRLSKFKKMFAALETGRYLTAADEALDSKWARQVGERAERIAEKFRDCS